MVQNMERLDETVKEEADGVHNTLGTTQPPSCYDLKRKRLFVLNDLREASIRALIPDQFYFSLS